MKTISPRSLMANVNVRCVVLASNSDSDANVWSMRVNASRSGWISARMRGVAFMPCPARWNSGSPYFCRSFDSAELTEGWLMPRCRAAAVTLPCS